MYYYGLVFVLASIYISYFVIINILLKKFTLKEILINAYILSALISIIFFKNDLISSYKKIDIQYIFLILLAIIMVLGNGCEIIAISSNINIGVIEGLANAIYLPIVAIISYYFYNEKITNYDLLGIVLIALGSCLITKNK